MVNPALDESVVQGVPGAEPAKRPVALLLLLLLLQKSASPSATTFMLLAVSFYLIITTLPVTICYALSLSFPEGDAAAAPDYAADPTWRRHFVYSNVRTLVEEMGLSHYACNFYIYLATGRVFRRELRRLCCRDAGHHHGGYSAAAAPHRLA